MKLIAFAAVAAALVFAASASPAAAGKTPTHGGLTAASRPHCWTLAGVEFVCTKHPSVLVQVS